MRKDGALLNKSLTDRRKRSMKMENRNVGFGLAYIMEFTLNLKDNFYKTLKDKTNYDESMIERIREEIPEEITFKLDQHENKFIRIKIWCSKNKHVSYSECDFPNYMYPFSIYCFPFENILTDDERKKIGLDCLLYLGGLKLSYDLNKDEVLLYLFGDRYEETGHNSPDDYNEYPFNDSVFLRLKTKNFEELEKFDIVHLSELFGPLHPKTYDPSDYERRYQSLVINKEFAKIGVGWSLFHLDFSGKVLPKLEKGKNIDGDVD